MNEFTINQCREILSEGKVESAINILLESTKDNEDLHNTLLVISGSFKRLKRKLLNDIIKDDEVERQLRKITTNILDILSSYSKP